MVGTHTTGKKKPPVAKKNLKTTKSNERLRIRSVYDD